MFFISYTIVGVIIPIAMGIRPGTYFWKPRLALDLTIPTTEKPKALERSGIDVEDLYEGYTVLIDGYAAGMTSIAWAAAATSLDKNPVLDLMEPAYWTNVYRWFLRYTATLPTWLSGGGIHFVSTVKAWKRRFYYMDEFIPKYLRKLLFFIKPEHWQKEYADWKKYKRHSEHAFGRFLRYPSKKFNDYNSFLSNETVDLNYDEVSSEE